MNKLIVILPLLLVAVRAAFLVQSSSRVPFKGAIKRNVLQSPIDWSPSSSTITDSSNTWVKESSMHQAIQCAEEECDVHEMTYHVSSLMQQDDECLFHQAFDRANMEECSTKAEDRHLIQRILELKQELHSLQQELKENAFCRAIKKQHQEEVQNHWYKDYLEFYHM